MVRGRVERTFLGLGLFSAIGVLLYGAYLLAKALLDPLGASEMTVLGAGFTISLSSFAIRYLLWPRGRWAVARPEVPAGSEERAENGRGTVLTVYSETLQPAMDAKPVLVEGKRLPGAM